MSAARPAGRRGSWRWALAAAAALGAAAWDGAPRAAGAQAPVRKEPGAAHADAEAALRARLADTVRAVLDRALADSAFPGAYAVIGTRRGILAEYGVGRIDWAPDAPTPDARTLWDLASLTKVVGTTSAIEQLVGAGRVSLDAPVQRYLPDWTGAGKERVTVRHLLTHSSGLPAWRPLYKEATDPASAMALVMATPLDTTPGARFVYSDLNAILLGRIVERVSGEALDAYVVRHVFAPLGMTDTRYRPPASQLARIAPTEFDPWRQRLVRGEPHDENAYALGGVAGHAGLFSTAADLSRFARMYLGGGALDGRRILPSAQVARFTRVQDTTISRRALGWETPTGGNSAGHLMSAAAFGHTGFTGTSLWMDPSRDVFVLLLTNRVNPTRQNTRIGRVRVALADAALTVLGGAPRTAAGSTSPPAAPARAAVPASPASRP